MNIDLSAARRWVAILAAGTVLGCATPLEALRGRQELDTRAGQFRVQFSEADPGSEAMVQRALQDVSPALTRWGGLKQPVRVIVLTNHADLERAVDKGYSWLRAWARYDEIFVQAPRTWSFFGATQPEVDELLLHELTHCVMYQQAGTATTWRRKEIPGWFREGMASWSAHQAYRWPTLEDLAQFYAAHPDADPVGAPEKLYQDQNDVVYGAAHHAFAFLVNRYGEDAVRRLVADMSQGAVFPEAFHEAIGIKPQAFVDDFGHYVRLRGFRGGRILPWRVPAGQAPKAAPAPLPPAPGTAS